MPIEFNQLHGKTVIRTTATESFTLAQLQLGAEQVLGATVTEVFWSANSTGSIAVARGANNLITLHGPGGGFWDLAGSGCALIRDRTANVQITITGGGTLVMELSKDTNANTAY